MCKYRVKFKHVGKKVLTTPTKRTPTRCLSHLAQAIFLLFHFYISLTINFGLFFISRWKLW